MFPPPSGSISWSYHYDWTYNKNSKIICVVNACGISQWMRRKFYVLQLCANKSHYDCGGLFSLNYECNEPHWKSVLKTTRIYLPTSLWVGDLNSNSFMLSGVISEWASW